MAQQWASPAAWSDGNPMDGPTTSVLLTSKDPAEVTLEIQPGAQFRRLEAEPLEALDTEGAPPLAGVSFECAADHVRVSVTIPTSQPGGRYSGRVLDEAGGTQGRLSVEVHAKATKGKRG